MRFIGEVRLRNPRRVYFNERSRFYVVEEDSRGRIFQSRVLPDNVDVLHRALGGQVVSVDDVMSRIEKGYIHGLRLVTNADGYKRRYEVQDILIVLAALGQATVTRMGTQFHYEISLPSDDTLAGSVSGAPR